MSHQLKPIAKWKFVVPIILAAIIILLYCYSGIMFIAGEFGPGKSWKNQIFSASSVSFLWLVSLTILTFLLGSYKKIRNLFLVYIIIKVFVFILRLIKSTVILRMDKQMHQIWSGLIDLFDLTIFILLLVLYGHTLVKRYNNAQLVKMFRPFAIVTIVIGSISFLLSKVLRSVVMVFPDMYKLWGAINLMHIIPVIFLIIYYIKLLKVYPQLTIEEKPIDSGKPWPPGSI